MKVSVELLEVMGKEVHSVQEISGLMNAEYQRIKASNPKGYKDQFESQLINIASDIAQNLGAEFDYVETNTSTVLLFDWSKTGGSLLKQRRDAILSAA